jgi:hypothetical protein
MPVTLPPAGSGQTKLATSGEGRPDGEGDAGGDAGPNGASAGARDEEGEDEDAGEAADTGRGQVEPRRERGAVGMR